MFRFLLNPLSLDLCEAQLVYLSVPIKSPSEIYYRYLIDFHDDSVCAEEAASCVETGAGSRR